MKIVYIVAYFCVVALNLGYIYINEVYLHTTLIGNKRKMQRVYKKLCKI